MAQYNTVAYREQGTGAIVSKAGGRGTFTVIKKPTLAEVNAGVVLVDPVPGKQILVTDVFFRGIGSNAADATDVRIQDTADTPVVVITALTAALASNANIVGRAVIANVTKGAGWLTALTRGKGLNFVKTGSTMTGATSFEVVVEYQLV